MAKHSVLVSIIFTLAVKKLLFEVLHFVYHTIDLLEDMVGGVVDEIFSTCAFTLRSLMGPLIGKLYFLPAVMAVKAALTIGELLVPVVVLYAGAKVGLNLVGKIAVNPVENIREYFVDPIEEYVAARTAQHDAVLKDYVVVRIGDCVAETIKNYALAPIQKYMLAPIQKYEIEIAPIIQKYMFAPIQKYEIEIAPIIQKYMFAPIQKYRIELAPIREYVVAPIKHQFRKLRYRGRIREVRAQIKNLRKIRELAGDAQENGEDIPPNVTEWLTSANGITKESMDNVEKVVEQYLERLDPLKSKRD